MKTLEREEITLCVYNSICYSNYMCVKIQKKYSILLTGFEIEVNHTNLSNVVLTLLNVPFDS